MARTLEAVLLDVDAYLAFGLPSDLDPAAEEEKIGELFALMEELRRHAVERLSVNVGLVSENKALRKKLQDARCQICRESLGAEE